MESILQDNFFNTDMTIVELFQLMDVAGGINYYCII